MQNTSSFQSLYFQKIGRIRRLSFDPSVHWTYFGHHTLDDLLLLGVTKEWYDRCFKFTFVRNTWDRLVSSYRFQRSRRAFKRRGFPEDLESFVNFVRSIINQDPSRPHDMRQLGWLKHGVDFVGRFEHLHRDWKTVCERVGVKHVLLPTKDIPSDRKPYQEHYTSILRDDVHEFFSDEIERFGFRFGG